MGLGPFDSEIFPMRAVIQQFTPAAAESAGKLNHVMRERYLVDGDADGIGDEPSELYDGDPISVLCQLERQSLEQLEMASGGDLATSQILISFSRGRLASHTPTLIDTTTGKPKIKKGDRLVRIETPGGDKVWTFDTPVTNALYCEQILLSDAYLGEQSNWFLSTWKSRKVGPTI